MRGLVNFGPKTIYVVSQYVEDYDCFESSEAALEFFKNESDVTSVGGKGDIVHEFKEGYLITWEPNEALEDSKTIDIEYNVTLDKWEDC